MTCPHCQAGVPDVAHFCHRCGQDLRTGDDLSRRRSFAVKPDEPVASFAILSTVMPRGAGQRPSTYRLALVIGLTAALLSVIFGSLPSAILVAVVTVPLTYIVYLYDTNLWDDQPVKVTGIAFGAVFIAALAFTIVWTRIGGAADPFAGYPFGRTLLFVLAVPIIGEIIRQIGPVVLASRPQFDDLLDGLTFGVVAGVAYSAAETLVMYWPAVVGGASDSDGIATWVSVIFLHGFIKPVILGTASGIAGAEFSGLGKGYDGFTRRYLRGVLIAVGSVVVFNLGLSLLGVINDATISITLSVFWGLVVAGALILMLRSALHTGLLEAALESAARDGGVGSGDGLEFCRQCEMPLLMGSQFCTACGASIGAQHRRPVLAERTAPALVGVGEVDDEPTVAIQLDPDTGPPPAQPTEMIAHPLDQGEWTDGDAGDSDAVWEVGPDTDPAGKDGKEDQS